MESMLYMQRPQSLLALHVESLWYAHEYRVQHRSERVIPNGRFQLVMRLDDAATPAGSSMIGLRSGYVVVDTAAMQSVIGVLFRPGGASAFLRSSAHEFENEAVALDLLWGRDAESLREELLEAPTPSDKFRVLEDALLRRIDVRRTMHGAVTYGLAEFHRVPHMRRVLEVVRDAGMSRRRFSQLFREQIGLTPKLYCRVLRFQQVVQQIAACKEVDWADVALAGGYSDQAHLARDFKEFSGLSPGSFLARGRPWVNHVIID